MEPDDILFSIDEYDVDGSVIEEGIYIHFAETRIKLADNKEEFKKISAHLVKIFKEILE